jgi:hypothetical protein
MVEATPIDQRIRAKVWIAALRDRRLSKAETERKSQKIPAPLGRREKISRSSPRA